MPPKQRILIHQRQALRNWALSQYPRPSQKTCIAWFLEKYGLKISQSTVSESLSSHFRGLDTANQDRSRLRSGQWPDLEKILYIWQQRIEEKGRVISGELLREKAQRIWYELPQYSALPCPEFSNGWLQKFKKRHNISEHILHGEHGSVPEIADEEMRGIRTIVGEYQEEDIYNMDEAPLYWKMMPSRGLATQVQPGRKKEKNRISTVLACNAIGTDRLQVWIIGRNKMPRALRNINVSTMGGEWRWNKKAWMDTTIMVEWLQSFYSHIGTIREVLLTMDNLSAHITALELSPPPPNIRVAFLPKNSTSRFQPLDQGIIQSFKSHYRRQWLAYMLDCYESDRNPLDNMNIHLAIRWMLRSWNNYISNTTIYNCFRKSTLVIPPISLPLSINSPDITSLYEKVQRVGNIRDAMAITSFLNPIEEQEDMEAEEELSPDEVLQEVINEHLALQQADGEDGDDGVDSRPQYTIQEAIKALQVVIEFTEGCDNMKTAHLRAIERLEQELQLLESNSSVQTTRNGWIT